MKHKRESNLVRWRLEHTHGSEFVFLSNLGDRAAVDVRVQLRHGPEPGGYGAMTFESVGAGVCLRLSRFALNPTLPPWDAITVTWRRAGRLTRKRRLRWDADVQPSPATAPRTAPRESPSSSLRVPRPRRANSPPER